MNNREIATIFEQVADLLEFQGSNPFRIRAYRNGARRIADHAEPLTEILQDESSELTDLEGIGKDLAEKITTLVTTGELPQLAELLAQIPESVLAILRVPGLGPKKAAALYKELGIESLDALKQACENQKVRELKGFGAKTEETILKGLSVAQQAEQRMRWADADAVVGRLLEHLSVVEGVRQMEMAGSYRRGCETVGDLDVLVDADENTPIMERLSEFPEVSEVLARGDTKMSVRLEGGLQIDLRVVPEDSFGAALQYFTGSKDHNVAVRGIAKRKGLKVNEWGVFRVEEDGRETYLSGASEAEVYRSLDLPCFPPVMREAREEFRWADEDNLPQLVELSEVRGDLHMHTNESDGKATLQEMVEAAKNRGLQYIAITDHSQRVSMANGLDPQRLRRQWDEIEKIREQVDGIVVLKGIECDILEKGGMDLPDDVLAEADWVIASVHYGQNQPRDQITERILGALENPHVDILAHPTGRLINKREPYEVDMEQVFAAASKHGKLMELNANPARLDIHDVHCAAAKRHGIPVVISTDAHHTGGLDVMRYGVMQARRGGLTAADVANTRSWDEFQKLIR